MNHTMAICTYHREITEIRTDFRLNLRKWAEMMNLTKILTEVLVYTEIESAHFAKPFQFVPANRHLFE